MKCSNKNCNQEVQANWKRCPLCETPINSSHGVIPPGGIIDSVVKADNVHVGDKHFHEAPDQSKHKQSTYTGMLCPICHQLTKDDWFQCPQCTKKYIHNIHQNDSTYLCIECSPELDPSQKDLKVGDIFGNDRYITKKFLGQGGMGKVFLVYDKEWKKDFAFKFLPVQLSADIDAVESLRKEAILMSSLNHDNLARIFDMGTESNSHYLKIEFIDGLSLEKYLSEQKGKKIVVEETISLLKQIINGLNYLHIKNIVHRDLKPGNIMLSRDGLIKILDFGISQTIKDTMTKVTNMPSTGTLVYMSPEQLMGHSLSHKSDQYSLGIIAYEMLAGRPPFNTGPIFEQQIHADPQPIPNIDDNLNNAILKALSKKDVDRFDSCEHFLNVIEGNRREIVEVQPYIENEKVEIQHRGYVVKSGYQTTGYTNPPVNTQENTIKLKNPLIMTIGCDVYDPKEFDKIFEKIKGYERNLVIFAENIDADPFTDFMNNNSEHKLNIVTVSTDSNTISDISLLTGSIIIDDMLDIELENYDVFGLFGFGCAKEVIVDKHNTIIRDGLGSIENINKKFDNLYRKVSEESDSSEKLSKLKELNNFVKGFSDLQISSGNIYTNCEICNSIMVDTNTVCQGCNRSVHLSHMDKNSNLCAECSIFDKNSSCLYLGAGSDIHLFSTNLDRGITAHTSPVYLLVEDTILTMMNLLPALEKSANDKQPLIIITNNEPVIETYEVLILNHMRGVIKIALIVIDEKNQNEKEKLSDIARYTGATVFNNNDDLKKMGKNDVGKSSKIIITRHSTILIGGEGDKNIACDKLIDYFPTE